MQGVSRYKNSLPVLESARMTLAHQGNQKSPERRAFLQAIGHCRINKKLISFTNQSVRSTAMVSWTTHYGRYGG